MSNSVLCNVINIGYETLLFTAEQGIVLFKEADNQAVRNDVTVQSMNKTEYLSISPIHLICTSRAVHAKTY